MGDPGASPEPAPEALEPSLYRYIWRHTRRDQVLLVLLTLATMPLVYLTLEVPKVIVNEALSRQDARFTVLGFELDQVQYLLFLSGVFLLLIFASGGIKYAVNVYRGVVGERMLRRFRYNLFGHLLRYPLIRFRDLSAGEVIPMVTAETEPLGGFIGDSIALPVFQGGLLITYAWFIFMQDIWLGLAAVALYPPQAILIPRLQRKINSLGVERVRTMRKVSDRIGETVHGAADIRVNATAALEGADIGDRLGKVFRIREEIYRRKFFVKFLSNFLGHLTPFFFYSIGGYLVIRGDLSLGALVAVLAAYKDIGPPWRELLNFYQSSATVRLKYAQIIDQFQVGETGTNVASPAAAERSGGIGGPVEISNVRVAIREHGNALEDISATIALDEQVGVLARDTEAARQFSLLVSGLLSPTTGRVRLGDVDMDAVPALQRGRGIGLCNADSFLFNASIRDNLYYGLKQRPVADGTAAGMDPDRYREAVRSGNSVHPVEAEWCDPGVAGVGGGDGMWQWTSRVIHSTGLRGELFSLALESYLAEDRGELRAAIVAMRGVVNDALAEVEGGRAVEPFDRERFCHSIPVAQNLLFGTPADGESTLEQLLLRDDAIAALRSCGLYDDFLRIGNSLNDFMLDLFGGVDAESDLFARYSFIDAGDLDRYRELAIRIHHHGLENCEAEDHRLLLSLTFKLCPDKHRLNLLGAEIEQRIVAARGALQASLGDSPGTLLFFDPDHYHSGFTVRANMLFGMVRHNRRHLMPAINECLVSVFESRGRMRDLIDLGLDAPCGVAGGNLSRVFRQKLLLARALIKNPEILVVDNALTALDRESQLDLLRRVQALRRHRNLVWTVSDDSAVEHFDRLLILEDGGIRDGTPRQPRDTSREPASPR